MRPPTACVTCRVRRRKCTVAYEPLAILKTDDETSEISEPQRAVWAKQLVLLIRSYVQVARSACINCEKSQLQCSLENTGSLARTAGENLSPHGERVWSSPLPSQGQVRAQPVSDPHHAFHDSPEFHDRSPEMIFREYSESKDVNSAPLSHNQLGPTATLALPSWEVCEQLVNLYFRYIHDTFHSLFHQPSLIEDVRQGTIPPVILLSIIALSCRFSDDPFFNGIDPRLRGEPFAREAAKLLDLRSVSVQTIQASVLLGACAIVEGEPVPESVYYSVACRLAMLLDLANIETSSLVERETNRRIWWTLNMIDVWSSNGVGLPRSIAPRSDVPFPMEELAFLNLRRTEHVSRAYTEAQGSAESLLTQMVKLNFILYEISQLVHSIWDDERRVLVQPRGFDAAVERLSRKLDDWYADVPSQMRDLPVNLVHYNSLGLGHFFVAVHLGYHHYRQLLYYPYLDQNVFSTDIREPDAMDTHGAQYAERCKTHATALCDILYRSYANPGSEVYYTMVGHVLVIASTVQLFILLFSPIEEETSAARLRLEKNFEILKTLQVYWPTLDVCFTRFKEFHQACLDEKRSEKSFRMDRWMLQFLFEFAKPVTDREGGAI